MIRVMIADDHQLFAEGLSEGLSAIPDLRVVGVVSNGSELLERLKTKLAPDKSNTPKTKQSGNP